MIFLALRNLGRSWSHHGPVALYFGLALILVFLGQGFLGRADHNLQAVYPGALTGDLAIAARGDEPWTLFGQQEALWGDSSQPPSIPEYEVVRSVVDSLPQTAATAGLVVGPALVDRGTSRPPVWVFGVDFAEYGRVMTDLRPSKPWGPGLWLSRPLADELGEVPRVRLLHAGANDFQLIEGPVSGTVDYQVAVTAVERLALVDVRSARHLLQVGVPDGKVPVAEDESDLLSRDQASLFEAEDVVASEADPGSLVTQAPPLVEATGWHFLLVRLQPGSDPGATAEVLGREFRDRGLDLRVLTWREAAGGSALYVLWVQALFSLGLVLLVLIGASSLVNAMTGIVVERTREIGTLRALGATPQQVFALFGVEALALVGLAFAGALGVTVAAEAWLHHRGLSLENPLLGLLFGSREVRLTLDGPTLAIDAVVVVTLALWGTGLPLSRVLRKPVVRSLEEVPE